MSSYYEKFLATGEVKCIDDEIPFEIPHNWSWVRLADLVQVNPKNPAPLPWLFEEPERIPNHHRQGYKSGKLTKNSNLRINFV